MAICENTVPAFYLIYTIAIPILEILILYTMEIKYVSQGHYARIRSNIQTQLFSDFNIHEFNPYVILPPFNMIAVI